MSWLGGLATVDAPIECRSKSEQGQNADLKGEQRFFGWRPTIERGQETHRGVEDGGLVLVVRHPLADHRQRRTCCPNRPEASENLVERSVDRHALQVRQLAASGPEARMHQHVGLQSSAKAALALPRTTSERRELAVILGQEGDDAVGVAIVDGAKKEGSGLVASARHGTAEDSSIGSSCAGARRTETNVATMIAKSATVVIASTRTPYPRRLRTLAKGGGGTARGRCSSKRARTSSASISTADA